MNSRIEVESHCDWRSVSQSVSKSWYRAPDIYYYLTITASFLWGALSDERTGLSFVYAADPCKSNLSRIRVPWDSRPYFTVSVRFETSFSSPPTTRRVTVKVLDPASTRETLESFTCLPSYLPGEPNRSHYFQQFFYSSVFIRCCVATVWFSPNPLCCRGNVPSELLSSNKLSRLSGDMSQ
jgi:hypothetical protein